MSRQSDKIVKGAQEYGAHQQGTAGAAAAEARLQIASPMVEAIEVKRLALGYTIALTVRGSTFKLEANAASGAPALAETFEQARAVTA